MSLIIPATLTYHPDEAGYEDWEAMLHWPEPEPAGPEIPPEIHNKRPIDGARCMEAVRAMSGGGW